MWCPLPDWCKKDCINWAWTQLTNNILMTAIPGWTAVISRGDYLYNIHLKCINEMYSSAAPSIVQERKERGVTHTHCGIHLQLISLCDFIIQWTNNWYNATATVNGKEVGWWLKRVKHAPSCSLVWIRGIHNENRSSHWCVLKKEPKIQE